MKRVIIIGGGFAGITVARKLERKFNVVLIDTKDYFEFTPSILRTIVDPPHIKKIQIPHSRYLKYTNIICDEVVEASDKTVKVKSGKKIKYDYLVIASGSHYESPIKETNTISPNRGDELLNCHSELARSNDITIIGGGIVGVELAGEIICKYPEKRITIIHSGKNIIHGNLNKSSKYAANFLTNKNVRILVGEKVIRNIGCTAITDLDKKINSEMIFFCTGIRPFTGFLKINFKSLLSKDGFIKTNKYLQLIGYNNIFACGDVVETESGKLAQSAELHARLVAKNIFLKENKKTLRPYIRRKFPVVINLGRWDGILEFGNNFFTGKIPAIIKQIIEYKEMLKFKNIFRC